MDPEDGSGIKTSAAPVSVHDLDVLRSRSRTLSNLGTYVAEAVTLSGRGEAVHLNGVRISPQVMAIRRSRGRALPVVVQIGLAVVLLLSSGLFIRSFLKLSSVDPGYATTRVLTFQLALSPNQPALKFSEGLIARIQGLPGVRAAGYADHLPLTRSNLGHAQLSPRSQARQSTVAPPPPPPGVAGKPCPFGKRA